MFFVKQMYRQSVKRFENSLEAFSVCNQHQTCFSEELEIHFSCLQYKGWALIKIFSTIATTETLQKVIEMLSTPFCT